MKDDSRRLTGALRAFCGSGLARAAGVLLLAAAALLAGLSVSAPALAAPTDYANFDHISTGWPLDGKHLNLRCEQCHLSGIFKGTPNKCEQCHVQGNPRSAVYASAKHVRIGGLPCESCHKTNAFKGAHFDHSYVTRTQSCYSGCHDGFHVVGAPTPAQGHPALNGNGGPADVVANSPTDASCGTCHTTLSFAGAYTVVPPGHLPTTQACNVCHSAGYSMALTVMSHAGISGGCTSCHAADAPATAPMVFTMTLVGSPPVIVTLKPTSQNYHLPTSAPPSHFPISESCEACHTIPSAPMAPAATLSGFAGGRMSHAGITGGCAACHADGKGPYVGVAALVLESTRGPHIPINGTACENCHKSTTTPGGFAGTAMVHDGLNGLATCSACHENNATDLGYYGLTATLVVRPPVSGAAPNAVTVVDPSHPATGECSQCHTSTTNFNTGIAAPSNHIPVGTTACANCHTGTAAPYAPVNTVMNHAGFASNCNACHGSGKGPFYGTAQTEAGGQPMQPPGLGGIAATPPHIPYGSADCSGCHSASTTSAGGFHITTTPSLSAAGHGVVSSLACATCHYSSTTPGDVAWYGTSAKGPGTGPIGTSGANNHIAFGSGDCKTCHGNSNFAAGGFHITTAPALSAAGHAAVSGQTCDSCHLDTNAAWLGVTTVAESVVTPIHIPRSTALCSACHASNFVVGGFKITTSPVLSVAGHTAVGALTCANCHEDPGANPTNNWQGVGLNIYLRPGTVVEGKSPVDASHATGLPGSGDCVQCHSTSPPFSAPKPPSNHIPLPSSLTTCNGCHANGYTPTTSTMVHSLVASETCVSCHAYTTSTFAGTGPGTGGQPWPIGGTSGGAPSASQHMPIGSVDCTSCHTASDSESAGAPSHFQLTGTPVLSAAGHAAVSAQTCNSCHFQSGMTGGSVAWEGSATTVGPPGAIGTSGAANHIALGTGDCKTCHATAASSFATGSFHITTSPTLQTAGHGVVTSVSCASCHGTGMSWIGVTASATNMQQSTHIGIAGAACTACHTAPVYTSTTGFHIATTPSLSVAAHTVVSSLSCLSCHENNTINAATIAWQGVGASIYLRPGTAAAGLSTPDASHTTGLLAAPNDCSRCHTTTPPFNGNTLPTNHIPMPSPAPACTNCHASGYGPGVSTMKHSVVTAETCISCHAYSVSGFAGSGPGTGGQPWPVGGTSGGAPSASQHIPIGSADCKSCHASSDTMSAYPGTGGFHLSATPSLSAAGHAAVASVACAGCHYQSGSATGSVTWEGTNAVAPPGTVGTSGSGNHIALGTGTCANCHSNATVAYAAGSFHITTTPTLQATAHSYVTAVACATCHGTGSAWFGATSLATALASHIPMASAACSACHTAPDYTKTTGFLISTTPSSMLTVSTHTVVASLSCTACHENNAADLTFQGVGANIFVRPGSTAAGLSPADTAHTTGSLAAPNNCANSGCHTTTPPFAGGAMPSNHIPMPATVPACSNCHSAGYGPTLSVMKHSVVTSETCTACHGKGKGPFAGSSQGSGGQPYQPPGTVGTAGSANHIPLGSADCVSCHASNDVETAGGTNFKTNTTPALSAAGHTAVVGSVTCDSCHYQAGNFSGTVPWYGTNAKAPPGTVGSPGSGNHIPLPGATPEACNVCHAATNYTSFAGTAMNHASISVNCQICHNQGKAWYGVTIKTNTLTPPHITVQNPATCEACHSASNFTAFGPGTAMNPTTHLQVPTTFEACTTCHENGDATKFYGVTIVTRPTTAQDANHPQTGDCGNSGCHTTTPPFTGGVKPSNHIPSSNSCGNCHTGYTPSTTNMNHGDSGVGTSGSPVACATCHGYGAGPYYGTAQGQAGGQPLQPGGTLNGAPSSTQHLPFNGATCNTCHSSTTVPGGFATGTVPHSAPFLVYKTGNGTSGSGSSAPKCITCHAPRTAVWQMATPWTNSTATMGSHQGSSTTADCTDCHGVTGSFQGNSIGGAIRNTLGLARAFGHSTVRGPNGLSKATGTAGAVPDAPFSHSGVAPGSCSSCHIPGRATAKPPGHFLTTRSCDSCHHSTATWTPVAYDHLSPRYRPQPGNLRCIDCHTTNTEIVLPGISRPAGVSKTPGGTGKRN